MKYKKKLDITLLMFVERMFVGLSVMTSCQRFKKFSGLGLVFFMQNIIFFPMMKCDHDMFL